MALFGSAKGKDEDVTALIAKKNYTRAIEVLREQLQTKKNDPRVRMQLGDVLIMAGKGVQAIPILMGLADEYARDGFAAKAISVFKKIQKIDPSRRDVEAKLASLIQEKQTQANVSAPPARGGFEIGIEEIGFEPPASGPISAPALEIGMQAEPADEALVEAGPEAAAVAEPELVPSSEVLQFEEEPLDISVEEPSAEPEILSLEPEPEPQPASPVVDRDFIEEEGGLEPLDETPEAEPMSDGAFGDELMSLVDEAFKDFPTEPDGSLALPHQEEPPGGNQIVVSPLFKDFSVDEMVAVIQGLKLLSFERGDVILREGQPGNSMYMLTAGSVRAFVRKDGKQVKVGDLEEGAFFGEISLLTGKPRSATVAALSHCELLELDRITLDSIAASHPHVTDVLKEFAQQRMSRRG